MVLRGGFLYGADEGRLTCLDFKTGDVAWATDKAGKGSICCVGNRLYFRNEGGPVMLVEVNPYEYVEHGRFSPPDKTDKPAVDAPGRRQRQALHPRPGLAVLLRRDAALTTPYY